MVNSMKFSLRFTVYSLQIAGLFFQVSSHAGELADPTRPPSSISAPVAEPGVEIADRAASLQSVIISKNRRAAIIDGQTIELGGKMGEVRLLEVNAGNVVIKTNRGREVLMLFPDVSITRADAPRTRKSVISGEKK